ncbi:MAG: hypothetical protein OEQ13_11175 [Acidobacteriota bacterium]|nr:hypothetical protein [Acidobacteriota bacterium]
MMPGSIGRRGLCLLTAAIAACAIVGVPPAHAQSGDWSASLGVVATGDPDDPYSGGSGPELAIWYVAGPSLDIGARIGLLTFDSDGMVFSEAPSLLPGEGEIVPVELALRFYPMGSGGDWFPILGLSLVVPVSDTFDARRVTLPGPVGVVLDGDWDVDGVGFGAEAGVRWDVTDKWFLELVGRYVVLGADSIGTVEVAPVISAPRIVATDLDSLRVAFHIGLYF